MHRKKMVRKVEGHQRTAPRPPEVPAANLAEVSGPHSPTPAAAGPREDRIRVGVGRGEENAT